MLKDVQHMMMDVQHMLRDVQHMCITVRIRLSQPPAGDWLAVAWAELGNERIPVSPTLIDFFQSQSVFFSAKNHALFAFIYQFPLNTSVPLSVWLCVRLFVRVGFIVVAQHCN